MAVRFGKLMGLRGCFIAISTTAVAVLIRWVVDPWVGDTVHLVTLYAAVAATTAYAGWRPALLATVLGYLACNYLFIEPRGAWAVQDTERLGLYLVTCFIIVGVGEALRVARNRAEANWRYGVAKQKRLREEILRRKKAEKTLREADRQKDAFLAIVAHELRNPLSAGHGALQLLRQSGTDKQIADEAHTILERQITNMVRLVDDLLDIARISNGKVELQKRRTELAVMCNDAVEASRPLIDRMGHVLDVKLPTQPVYLEVDPLRLTQVLSNLLNNAAKYTGPGGRIWLTAEQLDGEAVVTVKDTGLGIPHDMLPHIFDIFTQVDGAPQRSQGGLGLGLALAKRLTELHGGRIEANSAGPGAGSEVTVSLPVKLGAATNEPPPEGEADFADKQVVSMSTG